MLTAEPRRGILRPGPDHVLARGEQVFIAVTERGRAALEALFDEGWVE